MDMPRSEVRQLRFDEFSVTKHLEHFPAKWTPVRRRKCDQSKSQATT